MKSEERKSKNRQVSVEACRFLARRKGFVLEFCSTLGIGFYEAFRKILRSPFAKQLTGLFLLVVQRLRKLSRRGIIKKKSRTNCELGGRHCRLRSNPLLFGCKKGLVTKVTSPFLARRKGFEPPTFWFVAKHSIQLS